MTNEWKRVDIKDACSLIVDCVNRTAPIVDYITPYKMIRTSNVKKGWIDVENVRYVTEEIYKRWTRRELPRKGDIILTREAPLGEIGIIRKDDTIFLGQRLMMYRANPEKANTLFLYYAFQGDDLQAQIQSYGSGSTVSHMRVPDAKILTVLLPSLAVQNKVASILSHYDDLIENNTRRIQILEEMVRMIYQEWFVNFRFPGHEQAKFVESQLGSIPEGWEVLPFTDIADVLSGGTPKTTEPSFWDGEIPFFTPKDASDSFYVFETEKKITELGLSKCNSKLYPKDTVFITARGTVGKVEMPAVPMAMNQSCYALVGRNGVTQPFLFLLTVDSVEYLKKNTGGATFDTIIVDTFRRFNIIKPPETLIATFTDIVRPFFDNVLNLLLRNAVLQQTRDLLLPKLISGELDVSELNIEV